MTGDRQPDQYSKYPWKVTTPLSWFWRTIRHSSIYPRTSQKGMKNSVKLRAWFEMRLTGRCFFSTMAIHNASCAADSVILLLKFRKERYGAEETCHKKVTLCKLDKNYPYSLFIRGSRRILRVYWIKDWRWHTTIFETSEMPANLRPSKRWSVLSTPSPYQRLAIFIW